MKRDRPAWGPRTGPGAGPADGPADGHGGRLALLPPSATPLPPAELLTAVMELNALLEELAEVAGCRNAWGTRALRRNVDLALRWPETLEDAENQVDFVEELAEMVWDGVDAGFRHPLPPGGAGEQALARERRRIEIVGRLDEVAGWLCRDVERWRQREAGASWSHSIHRFPQDGHSF